VELRMIIEMRTYKTKPGLRSQFLEIFRSRSIPAHAEIGMKILGPFVYWWTIAGSMVVGYTNVFIVHDLGVAVLFCIVTMLGWGSWANTQKLAGKDRWPFELFYWDYAIGVFASRCCSR
jgi:hypothetical protein